jgi:hypothetical protein
MGAKMGSEHLGKHYKPGCTTRSRREWRGFRDTAYDYFRWLHNLGVMAKFILKPNNLKGMFRYRWMMNYTTTLDFVDRHTEGLRGPQLRIAHEEFDLIVAHMCDTMTMCFKADERIGNDKELSKHCVLMDENMMTHLMGGFPNLHMVAIEIPPVYTSSTLRQDGVNHYIDVAEEYGIPGDVCPMPAAELGCAIDDDYPIFGACAVHCNTTCDGSMMGNSIEMRHFSKIPHFQVAAPMKYMNEEVQDYAAQEVKNAIKFIEDNTGEKFDWKAYFRAIHVFNAETECFKKWLECSRTPYPQVIGNNVALYRDATYQVAGGRDPRFLETDEKITRYMEEGYKKKCLCAPIPRHRAIVWGVQAQYYTAFSCWLQNCWGILPLIDMLSLTSLKTFSESDPNQAYYDIAHLMENMTMRNRSNGGYEPGLYDCFRFVDYFHADMIIMYEHIGCKSMAGYHGLFDDLARQHNIHLVWVTHGLMDPRKASRKDMRGEVNRYMRAVMKEEPLDPSLEDLNDDNCL